MSPDLFDHPLFQAFLSDFRAANYFAAHERLEQLWIQSGRPSAGELRGLVHLAVACEHYRRGNGAGARGVFARALENLAAGSHTLLDAVRPFERILLDEVAGPLPPPGANFPR